MKVAQATLAKNIMFGTKKASSFELVCHCVFPIEGCSVALPKNLRESYAKSVARRKIGAALGSRKFDSLKKSKYLYFYRENFGGHVGPAKVIEVQGGGNMKVLFNVKNTLFQERWQKDPSTLGILDRRPNPFSG